MLKKIIIAFALILLFTTNNVYAKDFEQEIRGKFTVLENGVVNAELEFKTKNLTTEKFIDAYKIAFNQGGFDEASVSEGNSTRKIEFAELDGKSVLEIEFNDPAIGINESHDFSLRFSSSEIATKNGEVWEISLPVIAGVDEAELVEYELIVPKSFGELSHVSPRPVNSIDSNESYIFYFDKQGLTTGGASLIFGEFQVFNFNLNYHLENPVNKLMEMKIAIPPDTAYQKVIYENINPAPVYVEIDNDGNYLAVYKLEARERLDISVAGAVQVLAWAQELGSGDNDLSKYIKSAEYWEVDNPEIQSIAGRLGNVEQIYKYVIETLNYDYSRVQSNVKRKGAVEALKSPNNSICMEFTDLFIALARAKGIPAREVNGYAFTENQKLQPLSLVADVLHSWPEYWDSNLGRWIAVDPTWEDTTGGEDFFNKFDLRHITFVIHGESSTEPYSPGSYKLGVNPQKDIYVSIGNLPTERESEIEISVKQLTKYYFGNQKYEILVNNKGLSADYNIEYQILFDNKTESEGLIRSIAPYGRERILFEVPMGVTGLSAPDKIVVRVNGKELGLSTNKIKVTILFVVAISILLIVGTLFMVKIIFKRRK